MSDFALLPALQDIAREVARTEIMPRFLRVVAERKADGSLLTAADIASQRLLMRMLPQLAPYPVLGEEMSVAEQERIFDSSEAGVWVVDPIDGTTNFSRGLPCFSVSIALLRRGQPVLGVVYAPLLDECYSAAAGEGAWLNEERLACQSDLLLSQAVASIETKRLPLELVSRLASSRPVRSVRSFGAATLDWCWLAAGRADVMLYGAQKLWDFAAGALILREAGGCISTLENADFWMAEPWQRSVVAARSPVLFAQWQRWVQDRRLSDLPTL